MASDDESGFPGQKESQERDEGGYAAQEDANDGDIYTPHSPQEGTEDQEPQAAESGEGGEAYGEGDGNGEGEVKPLPANVDADDDDDGIFRPVAKRSRVAVLDDDDDEDEPVTRPKYGRESGENDEVEQEVEGDGSRNEEEENGGSGEVEGENEEAGEVPETDPIEALQNEQNENESMDEQEREADADVDADADADGRGASGGVSLIDIIERGAEERKKRARRSRHAKKDVEFINDADDTIQRLVAHMKAAAAHDRRANENGTIATAKLQLLDEVRSHLLRKELHSFMVENGMLHAVTEWLAPLPDRTLPSLSVREAILRSLADFPIPNPDNLKSSGLGKAVMYLRKHPKETKENKDRAAKLIHEWSRQIFNLQQDYRELTRDERERRDGHSSGARRDDDDDMDGGDSPPVSGTPQRRMMHNTLPILGGATSSSKRDASAASSKAEPKPGEPGFIPRARVPMPSFKDYVVRPKSIAEASSQNSPKKQHAPTGIERQLRAMREAKMRSRNKAQSAVELNIQGSKLV